MNPAHLHPLAAALAATAFTFTLAGAAKKSVRFQEIVLTEQDLGDDIITAQNSPGWGLAWFEQTKAADGGITFAARHIKRHMKGAARRGGGHSVSRSRSRTRSRWPTETAMPRLTRSPTRNAVPLLPSLGSTPPNSEPQN